MPDYTTPTAPTAAAGVGLNVAGDITSPWQGLVDEIERRFGHAWHNGVISGGVVTETNGTTVTVADIEAYVAGKWYDGSSTFDMSGKASGTHSLYLDSADDVTPLKSTTGALASTELLIAVITFDGTEITAVNDNVKVKGLIRYALPFSFVGTIGAGSTIVYPVTDDLWLEDVQVIAADNGSGTQFTLDVHNGPDGVQGTTVFTTVGNRPTVLSTTADYTLTTSGEPDGDRTFAVGDHVTIIVDEANDATNVSGILNFRLI
jgi:hypothetical protein